MLSVLSKKDCTCNNGNGLDDEGNGNGDDGDDRPHGQTNNNNGTPDPNNPIKPPPKSTLAPFQFQTSFAYVTSYVWVWKQGNKEKEIIRKKHITSSKKLKKPFATTQSQQTTKPKSPPQTTKSQPQQTTKDPWQNTNAPIDPKDPQTPNNNNHNNNNNHEENNNNGNGDDGGNGNDDDVNGTDDDDDDECNCLNGGNNGISTTPKPLPICYDGWAAWDFCQISRECPPGYFCDKQGGCCPEMPWKQSKIARANVNNDGGLTDEIQYYYDEHKIGFVIIVSLVSCVLFGTGIGMVWCMCMDKGKKVRERMIAKEVESKELVRTEYDRDVQLINMKSYQNE